MVIKLVVFVKEDECNKCRKTQMCECIQSITPKEIKQKILEIKFLSFSLDWPLAIDISLALIYKSHMSQQWRIEYPGAIYHVLSRGNGSQDIFGSDNHRHTLIHLLKEISEKKR